MKGGDDGDGIGGGIGARPRGANFNFGPAWVTILGVLVPSIMW